MLNKDAKRGWSKLDQEGAWSGEVDFVTGITLAAGDVTLTSAQSKAVTLEVATGHASNSIIIAATDAVPGKVFIVVNLDASLAAHIKVAGGTAVALAASKTAIVRTKSDGTDVLRVTADA